MRSRDLLPELLNPKASMLSVFGGFDAIKSDQRLWTADLCMLLYGHGVKGAVGDAISVLSGDIT